MWHEFSHVFLTAVCLTFYTKLHDYSVSFIQVLLFVLHAGTWHGFWTSSGHGISMAFAKKMVKMVSIGFVAILGYTAVRKTKENPCHIFYRVRKWKIEKLRRENFKILHSFQASQILSIEKGKESRLLQ